MANEIVSYFDKLSEQKNYYRGNGRENTGNPGERNVGVFNKNKNIIVTYLIQTSGTTNRKL